MVTVTGQQREPVTLELVGDFVNTMRVEDGLDELDAQWFVDRGLLPDRVAVRPPGLDRARALREALRELASANNGDEVDLTAATAVLDAQARRSRLAVAFTPELVLEPGASGVDAALGRLLAVVSLAMADGSWPRFKACRAGSCRWAFVDRSRNRSRRWCEMAVCGNRSKARAYRRRRAG